MHFFLRNLIPGIMMLICNYSGYAQTDSIDIFLKNEMQAKNIPGLQLAIIRNGKIVKLGNYGLANVQDSVPVTENTIFTINSMTKAFTGVAIMQLAEEGKIKLDAPVSDYLDSLPVLWRTVTIKQLFSHTSGIPNIMDANENLISRDGDDAVWQKVQTLPLDFKAGEKFSYNQTNYILLGKIINKLSGLHFTQFITQGQLQKVGMMKTIKAGFGDFNDVVPHLARGYAFRNGGLVNLSERFLPSMRTAAGMSSTAKELAEWVIALQNKKLLSEASLSALWSPVLLNNGKTEGFSALLNGYAVGWPVASRPEHSAVVSNGGGRSALFIYPEDNITIIILSNLAGSTPEVFIDEIAGFYFSDMKKENGFGLSPSHKLLRAALEKEGYKYAVKKADKFKETNKQFLLTEDEVNAWGYKLIEQNRIKDAVEIFKLNVHLYPNSSNTFDSLGETYAALGETQLAIANYETALRLNPQSTTAPDQLKKLRAVK